MKSPRASRSLAERFWNHVDRRGPDECWPWTASTNQDGYGRLGTVDGGKVAAHRLSYEMLVGPIPDGAVIMHSCDNPGCVNPEHLSAGSVKDNVEDKVSKGRQLKGSAMKQARLTEREALAIRSAGGLTGRALAKIYGVSPATITRVRRGQCWRHI